MWKHQTKYKGQTFKGHYGTSKKGDRYFYLTIKGKNKEYSGFKAARADGWVYSK